MTSPDDRNEGSAGSDTGSTRGSNPRDAATDADAAARQDQVKRDHDAMQESARRVEASVPAGTRDTPIQQPDQSGAGGGRNAGTGANAATDRDAAAQQERIRADHDAMQESARRVEQSVSEETRNTPIERANQADDHNRGGTDTAAQQSKLKADHDALQESARRVEASVPADVRETPVQRSSQSGDASEDTSEAQRNSDNAKDNADASRESARRVDESTPGGSNRDRS